MLVVVVYDIATGDRAGRRRLTKAAKKCADRGVAVQDSVYECMVNAEQYRKLREDLSTIIAPETDSICFYLLGNHYQSRIERLGKERIQWDQETFVF